MSSITTAHELHLHGASLREQDKLSESIGPLSQAIYLYQSENDYNGVLGAIQDRILTWKHLFLNTNDVVFNILALKDAESSLEISIAKDLRNKLHSSYFRLGEISTINKHYTEAISYYRQAIENFPQENAELGDYVYHLGEAIYLSGNKTKGKQTILEGLSLLKQYEPITDSFLIHVWISGAYKRLAELLKNDEPKEAINYLMLAKEIANLDKRLIIRKRQISDVEIDFKKSDLI